MKHKFIQKIALTCALACAVMSCSAILQVSAEETTNMDEKAVSVVADWKFNQGSSSGSLDNNTLVVEDQSGNNNDLQLITSSNGAKASDFLSFEDNSINGKESSIRFNGLKEQQSAKLNSLSGTEKEEYVKNELEYAYFETVDDAAINTNKFEDGYTIELVYMLPSDFNASDAWMNILAREGSGANLGSGQWDYEGHHGTMQVNISNCKEIQYMTQNATNSQFNNTVWSLAMDNGGAWYHIVITCDENGESVKAYLNSGEGFRNYTAGGMDGMYAAQDNGKFRIGATISDHTYQWADSTTTDMLTKLLRGNLQEVRISEGELAQSEWLYPDTSEYINQIGNNNNFELKNPDNYTIGFLPDTQNTIKFTPDVSNRATNWLIENGNTIGLAGLAHVGDLVENWDSIEQWENAQNAFMPLVDAGVPFVSIPGNHDFSGTNFDNYNAYFGINSEYAQKTQDTVTFENGAGRHLANYRFIDGGSYQYLLLQMPYEPIDAEYEWMDQVLRQYQNVPTIISSHNIFSCSDSAPDEVTLNEVGDRFWNIAKKYDSVFMMVAGHNHGSGFIDLVNDAGNPVIGMLVDYQFSYNGGNAWYRFAEMDETNNKIYFHTFSPYEASRSQEEKTSAFDVNFLTGAGNEKTYDFNFKQRFSFVTDKTILNSVISYAENAAASDEFNNVIASVQQSFMTALQNAKTVANNPASTQDEIDTAWQTLLNEIHKLGFVKGDITSLEKLVALATGYDLNDYIEAGQAEFKLALTAAQDLLADKDNAMADDIATAETNLLNAMLNLRYKADKTVLEEVIAEANKIDATAYTAESYAVLAAAVNEANAVLADENTSQDEVDAAVANVQTAMDRLVAVEGATSTTTPSGDNQTNNGNVLEQAIQTGQNTTTTKANAAKTGDFTPIAGIAVLAVASTVLIISRKKK